MCLKISTMFTGQGNINKFGAIPQVTKSILDVFLKIIPLQTQLFSHFRKKEELLFYNSLKNKEDNALNRQKI